MISDWKTDCDTMGSTELEVSGTGPVRCTTNPGTGVAACTTTTTASNTTVSRPAVECEQMANRKASTAYNAVEKALLGNYGSSNAVEPQVTPTVANAEPLEAPLDPRQKDKYLAQMVCFCVFGWVIPYSRRLQRHRGRVPV